MLTSPGSFFKEANLLDSKVKHLGRIISAACKGFDSTKQKKNQYFLRRTRMAPTVRVVFLWFLLL